MGEKERNGKKLFVPGDVPPSDLLQKRTASYAVPSLVMGARKDGKAYNSARYSVSFPHAEQNRNEVFRLARSASVIPWMWKQRTLLPLAPKK